MSSNMVSAKKVMISPFSLFEHDFDHLKPQSAKYSRHRDIHACLHVIQFQLKKNQLFTAFSLHAHARKEK